MKAYQPTYHPFGERSILVAWPSEINESILYDILEFKIKAQNHFFESKIKVKSAYSSVLITYDFTIENINDEISTLKSLYSSRRSQENDIFKLWKIPVCYHDEFGLDMDDFSKQKMLSKHQIVKRHSHAIYTVYFIGFLPGFLYLGGLDERLNFPRKPTPRLQVPKGAVAIGGNQTGVYPNESPGGWNIIGNSPIDFFDASKDKPCFAKPGDKIQFVPVTQEEYHDIASMVKAGVYQLESEVTNG